MRILFDIDDTLCATYKVWSKRAYAYFKQLGIQRLKPKRQDEYAIEDSYDCTQEQKDHYVEYMNDPKVFEALSPIYGARELLDKLRSDGHELIFITARPRTLQKTTDEWARKHLGLGDDEYVNLVPMQKFNIWATSLGIDMLVDDRLLRCIRAEHIGIKAIQYTGSYKHREDCQGITRADSYVRVLSIIRDIADGKLYG